MSLKTTYLITMAVDQEWYNAINNFTADVHDGELCSWISVDTKTEEEEDDGYDSELVPV